jgi:hypothetical protein
VPQGRTDAPSRIRKAATAPSGDALNCRCGRWCTLGW